MPVYIRKNISYTPPSLENFVGEDNEDDFVTDPEQIRDSLPQPYRMLDKVLQNILDDVWETISARESERLADGNRLRPPRYECSVQIKDVGKASCLCNSEDGEYIFVGLPNGLAAVESGTQIQTAMWEDEKTEIVQLKVSTIVPSVYVIATIDDMGLARLFSYASDRFHLLKLLNEQDGSANRIIASKCELSRNADYVGLVLENPAISSVWLEVLRLPRDAWIKELGVGTVPKREASSMQVDKTVQQQTDGPVISLDVEGSRAGETDSTEKLQVDALPAASSFTAMADSGMTDKKFSVPMLVLRNRPQPPTPGVGTMSIAQACKAAGGADVIGTGTQHLVTQQHMDLRQIMLEQLHENVKKFVPRNEESTVMDKGVLPQPTFHFLNAGRLMTTGMEQAGQTDRPLAVALWWAGSTQITQFALLKSSKDVEYKPDVVWPFPAPITCSALSPCTSIMAVGLESGNIVIWDRFVGIERGVIEMTSSPLREIHFVDPSVCSQDVESTPAFGRKTAFYLLALCADGSLRLKRCGGALCAVSRPVVLAERTEESEKITFIKPLTAVPRLLVQTLRDGSVYIQDVISGQLICEAALPQSHDTATPWQPVIAVGGGGQMLYLKGDPRSSSQSEEDPVTGESSLFVFQLRSFPTLDKFWRMEGTDVPYIVASTLPTVINHLMQQRFSEQGARKERLQKRWEMYSTELEKIRQHRATVRMNSAKSSFAVSSIPRTPMLINKPLPSATQTLA